MLLQHHYKPGVFDAGHCRACARQAGLLDHYRRVQQQEEATRARGPAVGPCGPPAVAL